VDISFQGEETWQGLCGWYEHIFFFFLDAWGAQGGLSTLNVAFVGCREEN